MKKMDESVLKLYEKGLIKFGNFTLSSGKNSSFYINLRVLPSYPKLFKTVMELALSKLSHNFDSVCGIATGGIPFAAYIAFRLEKPLVYIRKKKKEYGLKDLLVGYPRGTVLIVDDVVTTGGSINHAIYVLRQNNMENIRIFVIVTRNPNIPKIFREKGIYLEYLLDAKTIFDILLNYKQINQEAYERVMREINNTTN